MDTCLTLGSCTRISFFIAQYVKVRFYPLLQKFSHRGGTICCVLWAQTLVGLGISEMIFNSRSKMFLGINFSRAEDFFGLNNHQVWVAIYESNFQR